MEFKDIKKTVEEKLKDKVTRVDLEGPRIVIYTEDINFFIENNEVTKSLASALRKKLIIRPEIKYLLDPEETRKVIEKVVPKEAGIKEIDFDPFFESVYIEAEKLGVVIGKHGETMNEIIKETRWTPVALRKPPVESDIVESVRRTVRGINIEDQKKINLVKKDEWKDLFEKGISIERQQILKEIGYRIYRKPNAECEWVRIMPLGGAREVGRSCFLLKTPESNVLLDCGINVASQKNKFPDFRAADLAIDRLDSVIISHAHLDHCGFLPYLFKYGYKGPVYCTEPTRDLMTLLQLDALEIWSKENEDPPFSASDIREMLKHTIPLEYGEVADITPDMKITLYNAGHILGSSMVHIHVGEGLHNIVYSGDIKFGDTMLLEAANTQFHRVETFILESTYGGRYNVQPKRKDAEEHLIRIIKENIQRKSKVLIPVFSVGRSQEVMMVLEKYRNLDVPVFLDGMIWEATSIHTTYPEYLKEHVKERIFNGDNPFLSEKFLKVKDKNDRTDIINSKEPAIILSTAGMMTGGPSVEYFKNLCLDENNTIIFVGYQAEGSLGRTIQSGTREIPMSENGKTKNFEVKMNVATVDGFSGHADRRQLLGYIKKMTPRTKRVLTVHGEKEKCLNLASAITELFKIEASAPQNFDGIRLV